MTSVEFAANDPWLEPYYPIIEARHNYAVQREKELLGTTHPSLSDFADGFLYFGLHLTNEGWKFREWLPNATEVYLVGDFSEWKELPKYRLTRIENGMWATTLPKDAIKHEQLYKLSVHWPGGQGERIPAWVKRVVQDPDTKIFCAQVWEPKKKYTFKVKKFKPNTSPLLIYECHVGMAQEEEVVGSYLQFKEKVLPRIAKLGYNCIQIMAVQEHPYYGSFGYHVSNFFAPSSRFGTPEELKELVDAAHEMGIAVIMDLVQSHAVKNSNEGIGYMDGTPYLYFHAGARGQHPAWDSLCFDYGKNEVVHFLLSNCKYWMDVFHFDGFRFDGVTSMLYKSHGLGDNFNGYADYYNGNEDDDAMCYLTLANKMIHEINPNAITIAEEVSGMPGLAASNKAGGIGFDYRMAMGIPDYWIKLIKEKRDEDWDPRGIWWEMTNRRADEKTISYAESHDQALVGDKTIIFRLIDADMYWNMTVLRQSMIVDRGIALHKMIRLVTASTMNGGYLNFMGNEFGHPEWIDFPREGNGWSHKHARRQWHLVDDDLLKYKFLNAFDVAMIALLKSIPKFESTEIIKLWEKEGDNVLAYKRGKYVFVFNFNPTQSFTDYGILIKGHGKYKCILNSDDEEFGGFKRVDNSTIHETQPDPLYKKEKKEWLKLYLPNRTAMVLVETK